MKKLSIQTLFQALILCFFLAGLAITPSPVSAALRICHTDPILTFSDGTKMTVSSDITIDESSVVSVLYTIHAPTGLALSKTSFTAGGLGGREQVAYVADQPSDVFVVDTLVTILSGSVPVSTNVEYKTFDLTANGSSGSHFMLTLDTNPKTATQTTTISTTLASLSRTLFTVSTLK
jgi:hypothetical protein